MKKKIRTYRLQPPTLNSEFRVCQWCGHDTNPLSQELCEVCERPLEKQAGLDRTLLDTLSSKRSVRLLAVGAILLLVGGASYLFLGNQTPLQAPPSLPESAAPSSSPTLSESAPASPNPTVSSPTVSESSAPRSAPEISSAGDIRLYRTFQEVPNVPKGLFSYSSALAFASLKTYRMNDRIQQAHPEFQLRYAEPSQGNPGSTTAVKMLIDGEVSIAQSARPLEDEELNRARSRQITLEQIPVAIDGIVFYVHPTLEIAGLSINQAQDIFSGKVTNWKEVGGPDLAIVPMSLDPKAVSSPKQALGDVADKMGSNVQIIRDHTEGIRRVANTPGAISFGGGLNIIGQKMINILSIAKANSNEYVSPVTPSGEVDKQAFRAGTYPITRRLFVVIRRNGTLDEQAGVAYANLLLSGEGQQIIESAGFVPLY